LIYNLLIGIGYGALIGIFLAGAGYLKHTPLPDFSGYKFSQTIIVGAISGAVMAYFGVEFQTAMDWVANAGVITGVEYIKKMIGKRLVGAG